MRSRAQLEVISRAASPNDATSIAPVGPDAKENRIRAGGGAGKAVPAPSGARAGRVGAGDARLPTRLNDLRSSCDGTNF